MNNTNLTFHPSKSEEDNFFKIVKVISITKEDDSCHSVKLIADLGGGNEEISYIVNSADDAPMAKELRKIIQTGKHEIRPKQAPDLGKLKQVAIFETESLIDQAKERAAGTNRQKKINGYLLKVHLASKILEGTASKEEFDSVQQEALQRGIQDSGPRKAALYLADIWLEKNKRLTAINGRLDALETALLTQLKGAKTPDQIKDIMRIVETKINEALGM